MIQKDYILRMVQQMAELIGKLIGLTVNDSLEVIDEAYQEWLKIDSKFIDDLAEAELIKILVDEKGLHIHQLEFLATLLQKEGELFLKNKEFTKSKNKLRKALILFHYIDAEEQIFSFQRIATIKQINLLLLEIK